MAEYLYQGVDRAGKKVSGKLTAPSEGDLRMSLRGMGIRPTRISSSALVKKSVSSFLSGGAPTASIEALVIFTRQLNVLISSGIPLVQSLEILQDQTAERQLRTVLGSIREKVSAGAYLWESMAAYPRVFPKLYVALIRAGESSGAMDSVLKRLSRYLEDADRLRKMVKSAMMYPVIVVSIGIGVITMMLMFVIPKFEAILKSAGQELPAPTAFVIAASHLFANNMLIIFGGGGAALYLTLRYIKSEEGRAVLDRVLFRAPIFGSLMQKSGVARFSRTMTTLLAAGVNLIDAIDICRATIDNAVLEGAVSKIRSEVETGKTLGTVVGRIDVFPKMAVQMMTVGESTGNLDKMLEKIADFYEAEVETMVNGMTKLIEPLILVFLGGTVGGLMIAMYLPIFKIAGATG
jgi:type IV pilus assembly protein PilC